MSAAATPSTFGAAGAVRRLRSLARAPDSRVPRLHHRQRAEPQPLLAAADTGPNGENVAARDYLALLAETYDALKAVSDDARIIGGHSRRRAGDDSDASRHTHSPTQFIRDLGTYYRQVEG